MEAIPEIDINDYKVISQLGEGSFSRVYLVEHKETKKRYAAKETNQKYDEESKKNDFNKELLIYSRVNSPLILKIYGYSLKNFMGFDYPIIITEYMENSSLDNYFPKNGKDPKKKLAQSQKYKILLGIALGMKSLHSEGIFHRDLKPGNILLDSEFCPHICDFGISFISDFEASQILMNSQVGTPLYQAPEILSDEPYTNKVDIFSFSLIAYQMITDELPFVITSKKTPFQMQAEIIKGKRPDIKKVTDMDMANFLQLAWSNTPNERPSFDQIFDALLEKNYRDFFGVSEDEIDEFLGKFGDSYSSNFSTSRIIKRLKRKGDAESLFQLAVMYDQGDSGIEVDKKKASKFYRQACEKGSSDAMLIYGRKLLKGDGVQCDKEEAAKIYKKFADNGNAKAMNNYGLMLYYGNGIDMDKEQAAEYLKKSADKGNPKAMFIYAEILFEGDGAPVDKKMAAKYYKSAADEGNIEAMLNYAEMCLNGEGIEENKKEAASYYEKFSIKGDSRASYNLGIMMLTGNGIPRNKKKASELLKTAADQGETDAMFNYGVMRFIGDGIMKSRNEGARYIKMAADAGNETAAKFYRERIAKKMLKSDDDDDEKEVKKEKEVSDEDESEDDLSTFSVLFRGIVSSTFYDAVNSLKIKRVMKNEQNKADFIIYEGSLTSKNFHDFHPAKHLNKIPGIHKYSFNPYFYQKLNEMKSRFPAIFKKIFPLTFMLPEENAQFIEKANKPKYESIPWIIRKNRKGSKSRPQIIQNANGFDIPEDVSVIQPFISPYLIDNHKFELRVYVMITKLKPLTMFIYEDCFALFCSEPFSSPTNENFDSYVFQKNLPKESSFEHIRSAREIIREISYNNESMWEEIKKICALAILSIYKPILETVKEPCENNDKEFKDIDEKEKINPFQRFITLFAVDILIDENKNPLIIGLNDNPGMRELNEFDKKAKIELIKNQFRLISSILQDPKSTVPKWSKIIPSNNYDVKAVLTEIKKEIDGLSPKKRSLTSTLSLTYLKIDSK